MNTDKIQARRFLSVFIRVHLWFLLQCRGDETMIQISPSILAADFSKLGAQVAEAEAAGAARLHVDVMDGHFVPNLSMGPVVVEWLRPLTKLFIEVHLMVEDPAKFVP